MGVVSEEMIVMPWNCCQMTGNMCDRYRRWPHTYFLWKIYKVNWLPIFRGGGGDVCVHVNVCGVYVCMYVCV